MPRPRKCRRVGCLPSLQFFGPFRHGHGHCPPPGEAVVMTVDEFESIRLIDHLGHNQEQCAASMAVARTTAQRIYDEARRKLAECLVNGKPLLIDGGEYVVSPEDEACPGPGCCARTRSRQAAPAPPAGA